MIVRSHQTKPPCTNRSRSFKEKSLSDEERREVIVGAWLDPRPARRMSGNVFEQGLAEIKKQAKIHSAAPRVAEAKNGVNVFARS
jgi:hypothetical protein